MKFAYFITWTPRNILDQQQCVQFWKSLCNLEQLEHWPAPLQLELPPIVFLLPANIHFFFKWEIILKVFIFFGFSRNMHETKYFRKIAVTCGIEYISEFLHTNRACHCWSELNGFYISFCSGHLLNKLRIIVMHPFQPWQARFLCGDSNYFGASVLTHFESIVMCLTPCTRKVYLLFYKNLLFGTLG